MNERRKISPRKPVDMLGTIVAPGGEATSHVRNITGTGLMAETRLSLTPGDGVTVYLKGVGGVAGTVKWTTAQRVGVSFNVALSPSLLARPLS